MSIHIQHGGLCGVELLIYSLEDETLQVVIGREVRHEQAGRDERDGDHRQTSPQGHSQMRTRQKGRAKPRFPLLR